MSPEQRQQWLNDNHPEICIKAQDDPAIRNALFSFISSGRDFTDVLIELALAQSTIVEELKEQLMHELRTHKRLRYPNIYPKA